MLTWPYRYHPRCRDPLDPRPQGASSDDPIPNNFTEQSHRAVNQRSYTELDFGSFESAWRFCAAT